MYIYVCIVLSRVRAIAIFSARRGFIPGILTIGRPLLEILLPIRECTVLCSSSFCFYSAAACCWDGGKFLRLLTAVVIVAFRFSDKIVRMLAARFCIFLLFYDDGKLLFNKGKL